MSRRLTWIVVLAVVAGLGVATWLVLSKYRQPRERNIILISVDTLRPDHLGCYGYGRPTSPNVDAFRREATLFSNCFSQAPTTRPSCASFLSGFLPHECRIFNNVDNIPAALPMVAERLRAAGYKTMAVSSNFVLGRGTGYDRGFDLFDNDLSDSELVRRVPERVAPKTTDAAIRLLRIRGRGNFFMWIHYQDPHGPYTPASPFDQKFVDASVPPRRLPFNDTESGVGGIPGYQRQDDHDDYNFYVAQYDGEIAYFDANFGRLVQALKTMGLYDRTLIILTADHGEGMGERDYYFAHGEFVYNNLVHVPLIVKRGGSAGGTKAEWVQLLDLVPTMLAYAGIKRDSRLRGRDLLGSKLEPTAIYSEMDGKYAVLQDGIKFIYHGEQKEGLLYDVRTDPGELHNLIDDPNYARYVEPLAHKMSQLGTEDRIGAKRMPGVVSDEDREKLKSLGYVH